MKPLTGEGRWVLALWSLLCGGFGAWMLFWPRSYWNAWKRYLRGGDPFESWFPGRTAYLRAYLQKRDRNARAERLGALLVMAALVVMTFALLGP